MLVTTTVYWPWLVVCTLAKFKAELVAPASRLLPWYH